MYETNFDGALRLGDVGVYSALMQTRYGSLEREIAFELSLNGPTSITDLCHLVLNNLSVRGEQGKRKVYNQSHESQSAEVGTGSGNPVSEKICKAVDELARDGVVRLANQSHFRSPEDNRTEALREFPPRGLLDKALKKEEQIRFNDGIQRKLEAWRQGIQEPRGPWEDFKIGSKRQLDDAIHEPPQKKRKTGQRTPNYTLSKRTNSHHTQDDSLQNEPMLGSLLDDRKFQLNHDKLRFLQRNDIIIGVAHQTLGAASAKILKAVLRKAERSTRDSMIANTQRNINGNAGDESANEDVVMPKDARKIPIREILDLFPDPSSLQDAIAPMGAEEIRVAQIDHRKKHRRKGDAENVETVEVNGTVSPDESVESDTRAENVSNLDQDTGLSSDQEESDDDELDTTSPPKPYAGSPIYHHLLLLSQATPSFLNCHAATKTTPESFSIPFTSINAYLRTTTVLATANARFGITATRLIRILQQKGRLDEKTISSLALLRQKDVRSILAFLQKEQFLELCELPRDAQRSASKSFWLWWWDETRVANRVIEDCYKSMANLIKRMKLEREDIHELLKKSEREDVQGNEDKYLSDKERQELKEWRDKEERIWGEVARMSETVSILKPPEHGTF